MQRERPIKKRSRKIAFSKAGNCSDRGKTVARKHERKSTGIARRAYLLRHRAHQLEAGLDFRTPVHRMWLNHLHINIMSLASEMFREPGRA